MSVQKYSKIGEYHKTSGSENEDVILIRKNSQFIFCALADGVSSREFSKEGAQIACDTAAQLFMRTDRQLLNCEKTKAVNVLLSEVLYNLKSYSKQKEVSIKEYASTLMFVLFDKKTNTVYILNLGDGICVATLGDAFFEIAHSDEEADGCFVTTTENVNDYVFFEKYDAYKYDSFILMSDGAWRTIYNNGKIEDVYKEYVINKDIKKLQKVFDETAIDDDCSFLCVDLSDLRAKGLL